MKKRTKSIFAGDEPRNREITEHWPKRRSALLPPRTAKLKRKDKANNRAAMTAYRGRLTAPWAIHAPANEGGQKSDGPSV